MCLLAPDLTVLSDAGSVIAIGVSVVFLVLLLLTAIFKVFGMVMSRGKRADTPAPAPKAPAAPAAAPAVAAAPVVGNTETVRSKPDVDGGVAPETVAVISAAVASVASQGTQYAVRGIRKL